jgi:hypothetical protein
MNAATAASVAAVDRASELAPVTAPEPKRLLDNESREWLRSLRADGAARDEALARLHELLLRVARFEVARRRPTLPHLRGNELEDIANEAADDALVSVLRRLDDFRGDSRFTTWVNLLWRAVDIRRIPSESEEGEDRQHNEDHTGERRETKDPETSMWPAGAHAGLPADSDLRRARCAMPATPR